MFRLCVNFPLTFVASFNLGNHRRNCFFGKLSHCLSSCKSFFSFSIEKYLSPLSFYPGKKKQRVKKEIRKERKDKRKKKRRKKQDGGIWWTNPPTFQNLLKPKFIPSVVGFLFPFPLWHVNKNGNSTWNFPDFCPDLCP